MSGFYTGPCSDCGSEVSTHPDGGHDKRPGGAFSSEKARDGRFGAVYLLCATDIARRELSPQYASGDWTPGPKHQPHKVLPQGKPLSE